MASTSGSSTTDPTGYCKTCGYDLRGLPQPRCPECGNAFDPQNPKTFSRRPPRSWIWRWSKRALVVLLVLIVLLGGAWGWLYWGWKQEQAILAGLKAGDGARCQPLVSHELYRRLGRAGFVLQRVWILQLANTQVTDAGLVHLKDLRELQFLSLDDTKVTDAGLVHVKDLQGLERLYLVNTQVTDAGLVHLKNLKGLRWLALNETQVTDAGLAHVKDLKGLERLYLANTQVTDAGLVHLNDLKALQLLQLTKTQVTDAGLVHLKDLTGLHELKLANTRVTDAGLVHLKDLMGLHRLDLRSTQVTDAGLVHLEDLRELTWLGLTNTKVTAEGVQRFAAGIAEGRDRRAVGDAQRLDWWHGRWLGEDLPPATFANPHLAAALPPLHRRGTPFRLPAARTLRPIPIPSPLLARGQIFWQLCLDICNAIGYHYPHSMAGSPVRPDNWPATLKEKGGTVMCCPASPATCRSAHSAHSPSVSSEISNLESQIPHSAANPLRQGAFSGRFPGSFQGDFGVIWGRFGGGNGEGSGALFLAISC